MNAAAMETLAPVNWLDLLGYFLTLSLMTVGGAIATAPDMHRCRGCCSWSAARAAC